MCTYMYKRYAPNNGKIRYVGNDENVTHLCLTKHLIKTMHELQIILLDWSRLSTTPTNAICHCACSSYLSTGKGRQV